MKENDINLSIVAIDNKAISLKYEPEFKDDELKTLTGDLDSVSSIMCGGKKLMIVNRQESSSGYKIVFAKKDDKTAFIVRLNKLVLVATFSSEKLKPGSARILVEKMADSLYSHKL